MTRTRYRPQDLESWVFPYAAAYGGRERRWHLWSPDDSPSGAGMKRPVVTTACGESFVVGRDIRILRGHWPEDECSGCREIMRATRVRVSRPAAFRAWKDDRRADPYADLARDGLTTEPR